MDTQILSRMLLSIDLLSDLLILFYLLFFLFCLSIY